ncbi:hypothetical protein A4D02_08870 [Niastella koreensis]|uniref:Lipoprotein n=2 Tax=Niastella koreensis TaxID=354356 RepID=G8TQA3_NIAKG|nr:hypothetical protein [Niastella koreensis]AEW02117.1 hypothetical protein Niako_5887 [Niastella koreensis GR20-10]OQP48803.1 hypothetical protein A4D02_08870 [Niastella koreensis]
MKKYRWSGLFLCWLLAACLQRPQRPVAFYYWKTQFSLNGYEREILQENKAQTLYVRYFDVDFKPEEDQPVPVSPVQLDTTIHHFRVIPVIFIKNRTFERLQAADIPDLAQKVATLIAGINKSQHVLTHEVQFDCDWTETTRANYFQFIQQYRNLTHQPLSATIRLHQVKYKERTGIPPVDRGVLMYYNMGAINGDNNNSIYERSIANRYNACIKSYPLFLDVALPVFSWALQIRNGKVVALLNKITLTQFGYDSNFVITGSGRYLAKNACFKNGYYFQQDDEIKPERVSADDLLEITNQINQYTNRRIGKIIFYDLDSTNLVHYEKDIFKKVSNNLN